MLYATMHTMWRSTTQDRGGCNHCKCNRFHIGQACCLTGIVLSIEIGIFFNGGYLLLYLSLVLRCLFEESFVYCCVSFYVALADVVLSTRIMICSYCCVTLSIFVSMLFCSVAEWFWKYWLPGDNGGPPTSTMLSFNFYNE